MAIVNRDLDVSEQKDVIYWQNPGATLVGTNATLYIAGPLPYPAVLQSGEIMALGLSGSPQLALFVSRFAGGLTSINLGISNVVVTAFGTSGALGFSGLAPQGSTLLNLLPGDVLVVQTSGANTYTTNLALQFILKKTQDVVSYNGIST